MSAGLRKRSTRPISGSSTTAATSAAVARPGPRPSRATAISSSGTPAIAPMLAPIRASVIERPWWRSNHGATVAEMPVVESVDQPMPTRTKQG